MYSFSEIGMTKQAVLNGIDAMRAETFETASWSGKVYLVDPRDNRLWDLKIVLRVAAETAGIELYPEFTSDRYRKDLLALGISYVRFHLDRRRNLGIGGNDPSELLADHDLYLPNGAVIPNGAMCLITLPSADEGTAGDGAKLAYESGVRRLHQRIERQVGNARRIKEECGLTCRGCDLDAEAAFGRDMAMSCMEAHHLLPVAEIPEGGRAVGFDDFAVLCATCHRLIHCLDEPDDIEGLRHLVREAGVAHTG